MHYNSVIENYFVRENSDKYEEFLLKPKNDFVFKKIFGDAKINRGSRNSLYRT